MSDFMVLWYICFIKCRCWYEKEKRRKSHVPFRVNLLFLTVFALFSVLILRLGLVQIVYGENYEREVEKHRTLQSVRLFLEGKCTIGITA